MVSRCQPRHDIEDVLGAQAATLQYQFNSHQHRIELGDRHCGQNLRNDPVATDMARRGRV